MYYLSWYDKRIGKKKRLKKVYYLSWYYGKREYCQGVPILVGTKTKKMLKDKINKGKAYFI